MASVGHFRDEQGRSAFRLFAPLALQVDVRGGCAYDHASTQRDAIRFMTPRVRLKNHAGSCAGPRARRVMFKHRGSSTWLRPATTQQTSAPSSDPSLRAG